MSSLLERFVAANPMAYEKVETPPCGGSLACYGCDECKDLRAFIRNQQQVWRGLASFAEIRDAMVLFLEGKIQCTFNHVAPLNYESTRDPEFHRALVDLTRAGFVTIGSQPQRTPEPPHHIRQRSYVEFIAHRDHEVALAIFCQENGYVLYVEDRLAHNPTYGEVHKIQGVWRISVTEQGPRRGLYTSCPAITSRDWGRPQSLPGWYGNADPTVARDAAVSYFTYCVIDPNWDARDMVPRLAADRARNALLGISANTASRSPAGSRR